MSKLKAKYKLGLVALCSLIVASIVLILEIQKSDQEARDRQAAIQQKAVRDAQQAIRDKERASEEYQKPLDNAAKLCEFALREKLKDPDSLRVKSNSPLYFSADEISVSISYSATNSYGGRVSNAFLCNLKKDASGNFSLDWTS